MSHILEKLHQRIESYPYHWALEGKKLDAFGYDLILSVASDVETTSLVEWTEVAETVIRRRLTIDPPTQGVWRELEEEEYIEGIGTGIQVEIEFEKAGPVNQVSLELMSAKDVELKGLLFQEDSKRYSAMKEIVLRETMVTKSNRSLNVNLPQPIYAKKLIFILVQEEYAVNRYILPANYRAKMALLEMVREQEAFKTSENVSSKQYELNYKDQSEDIASLFRRSGLDGYAEAMKRYKEMNEEWLKTQRK